MCKQVYKALVLLGVLFNIFTPTIIYADARIDVITRKFSSTKNNISGEIRIIWTGDKISQNNYLVQMTDENMQLLKEITFKAPYDKVNLSLSDKGFYISEWLSLSAKHSQEKMNSIFIQVIPQKTTNRNKRNQVKTGIKSLSLEPLSYKAKDVEVKRIDKVFRISGIITENTSNQPLPFVQVSVVVANKQYEIPFIVNSNENGVFSLTYTPQGEMFGEHRVSVIHPDSQSRPEQVSFYVLEVKKPSYRTSALPDLQFKRSAVKTGVRLGEQVTEKIIIENKTNIIAKAVKASLISKDNFNWARIISQVEWDSIESELEVDVQFVPPKTFKKEGEYSFDLSLEYGEKDKKITRVLPITLVVTNNVTGDFSFKVDDIYTNYSGQGGNTGVKEAHVVLTSAKVKSFTKTQVTNSNGKVIFKDLPVGFYNYQISAEKHTPQFGEIYVRAGVSSQEKILLEVPVVQVKWSVTETMIEDKYEIVVDAIYETDVPAPVIVIEPPVIVLPDMSNGETLKGAFSITNEGLVSAKDFTPNLPKSDKFVEYSFEEEALPDKILPGQTVYLPYIVTAIRDFTLTNNDLSKVQGRTIDLNEVLTARGKSCSTTIPYGFSTPANFSFQWTCANDEETKAEIGTTYTYTGSKTYTHSCSSSAYCKDCYWWWGWGGRACNRKKQNCDWQQTNFPDFEFPGIGECAPYLPNTCEE